MIKRGRILTQRQLESLERHKYSCQSGSILEPYLQPFWNWLVEQIPMTWAPNAITLWGLVGNIVSTVVLMCYCPTGSGEAPKWCYILCAFFLFLYQTLDNIDGKQARRTGSSSPLGELFDHGCDSLSMVMIVVGVSIAAQMGTSPCLFSAVAFLGMILFYAAQWQTAVIGCMRFGFVDVTEGQMLVMALYLFNALFGSSVWNLEIAAGLRLNAIGWSFSLVMGLRILFNYLEVICTAEDKPEKIEDVKEGLKRSVLSARYLPALPIILFSLLGFACSYFSESKVMENNLVLYHVTFGLVASKLCCLVLISYMTRTEMPCLDSIFLGPCILLAAELFHVGTESFFLWIVFFFNLVNFFIFATRVCLDICDRLDIHCFKIVSKSA